MMNNCVWGYLFGSGYVSIVWRYFQAAYLLTLCNSVSELFGGHLTSQFVIRRVKLQYCNTSVLAGSSRSFYSWSLGVTNSSRETIFLNYTLQVILTLRQSFTQCDVWRFSSSCSRVLSQESCRLLFPRPVSLLDQRVPQTSRFIWTSVPVGQWKRRTTKLASPRCCRVLQCRATSGWRLLATMATHRNSW